MGAIDNANERPYIEPGSIDFLDKLEAKPRWHRRKILQAPEISCTRHLYKYFPLDEGLPDTIRNVRLVLVESKIWLSAPSSFNDPFDFRAYVELTKDRAKLRHYFETSVRSLNPKIKGYRKRREADVGRAMNFAIQQPSRANLAFKNVRDRNGVCCFTRDARSLLMWAHYARSHTGICLAFSVADDMGLLSLARPVNYTASFPKLIWPDDKDRVVENVIFHKEEIWRYEREMRLVDRGGPNRSLRMAPKALVGVILGASCSKQTESLVRDMLGERTAKGFPAVRIYQAEPKIDAYGLRVLSA